MGRGGCQILRLAWQSLSHLGRGGRQGTRGSEEEMGGWEERKGGVKGSCVCLFINYLD